MSRIIAGTHGGRRIATPDGQDTRPTADRVREAMFGALDAAHALYGRRFLDLYAGSGAVGLEAVSRGAAHALLVESDPKAVRIIRGNVTALDVGTRVAVAAGRVAATLAGTPAGGAYDVVFADPPYESDQAEIATMLSALVDRDWLNPGGIVIVERSKRSPGPEWVPPITGERSRRYGETMLWYGRRS